MLTEDFKKFIEQKRSAYQKIGKVFCPALDEEIVFNAKGFYHLRYDGLGKERSRDQQISRMNLLALSAKVIKSARNISEKRKARSKSGKTIEYWALEKLTSENWKVIVILKKIGSGNIAFHSIWKKKRQTKKPSEDS